LDDHPFEHLNAAESGHFRNIEWLTIILYDKISSPSSPFLQKKQLSSCTVWRFLGGLISELLPLLFFAYASLKLLYFNKLTGFVPRHLMCQEA